MTRTYRPVPVKEVLAELPKAQRARIARRTKDLIAEEMELNALRKDLGLTQEEMARRTGGKQVYISRMESRADVRLSTLRDYVVALGGRLELVVRFPEGRTVRVTKLGSGARRSSSARPKSTPELA